MSTPTDAELAVLADATRRRAIDESGVAGGWGEEAFDRAARLAGHLLGVPVALVSIVDDERQCFVGSIGLAEPWATTRRTPLSHSFCRHVVVTEQPLVVTDAREDDRVRTNLAIRDLGVVAYLGVPLRAPDGVVLGSLCAIDSAPRAWTEDDVTRLEDLAAVLASEFALRAVADRLRSVVARAEHSLRTPVTALQVQLAELVTRPELPDDVRDDLATAAWSANRVADAASRVGTTSAGAVLGVDRRVDVRAVLADVVVRRAADGAAPRLRLLALPETAVPAAVPGGALADVVDELVGLLLEHGDEPVSLSVVTGPQATRIRLETEASLPTAVATELMRQEDHDTEGVEVPPSLATRVARRVGGRLVLAGTDGVTAEVVLAPVGG